MLWHRIDLPIWGEQWTLDNEAILVGVTAGTAMVHLVADGVRLFLRSSVIELARFYLDEL